VREQGEKLKTKNALFQLVCAVLSPPVLCQSLPALPQGNTGIAAQYPGDSGISKDSAVIFADDFEGYSNASGLPARWNGGVYHNVRIATESGNVYYGSKSVEFRCPQQSAELSNTIARDLAPRDELETLFLRYYTKFDPSFDVAGSSHNGGGMSAHYFINGQATPGVPANGYNKFLAEFESWRGTAADTSPGLLNVYIYHPEQRSQWGDHFFPNGEVMPNTSVPGNFGSQFVPRKQIICKLGRWYCCELMVKANTVGARDGRIACWLDGVLVADFPNLRLRDADSLKINRFNLSLHAGSNTAGETWKYYDNVVAAKTYIGPLSAPGSIAPRRMDYDGPPHRFSVNGPRVSFALERSSFVAVDLFSVQGKRAACLINGILPRGKHRIQAVGKAAEGVYVVRVSASDATLSGTMVLTRQVDFSGCPHGKHVSR
jgi:hypothetical protein